MTKQEQEQFLMANLRKCTKPGHELLGYQVTHRKFASPTQPRSLIELDLRDNNGKEYTETYNFRRLLKRFSL